MAAYEEAIREGRRVGASHADDPQLMAMFCDTAIQALCGAVSPKLVWRGAQAKGLTTQQLTEMAHRSAIEVSDLMWVD